MNYHISTGLILQEFNDKSECPLCRIRNIVENKLIDQFSSEAVMVDDYRKKVNESGFCKEHYRHLLLKSNKLGLALQNVTRLKAVLKDFKPLSKPKNAKKQAEELKKTCETCVVCEMTENNMQRYYKTVAQMYYNEPKFREILASTRGFCVRHYAELLTYCSEAKSETENYLAALSELEKKNIDRLCGELQWFCDKHDYRNRDKDFGTAKDSPARSAEKLQGLNSEPSAK